MTKFQQKSILDQKYNAIRNKYLATNKLVENAVNNGRPAIARSFEGLERLLFASSRNLYEAYVDDSEINEVVFDRLIAQADKLISSK